MVISQGTAVPIVKAGKRGFYELDEQALWNIVGRRDIADKRVVIISVAGAFRKGKSFLLNFFVHYLEKLQENNEQEEEWFSVDTVLDKFQWRGGTQRDTHGIMMWSEPFVLEDQNGGEIVVLLMDTQGTFDSNSTIKECATIFALSTMLSSLQIFNVSQNIQEDDLQHLQLFTQFAKLAKKSGDEAPFQSLMFLVRDWQNSEEFDYGYDGGESFLTEKLKTSLRQPRELREVRKDLRSSFTELRCYLMPHPGLRIANNNKEKKLGNVEEDFKEQLLEFVPSVFSDLEAKRLNGQEIECAQLLQYFRSYISVFKGNTLPSPKTVFEASVDASNISALEKAKTLYQEAISTVNTTKAAFMEFDKAHENGKAAAIKAFTNAPRLGGDEAMNDYLEHLNAYIQERYSHLSKAIKDREELQRQKGEQERRAKAEREKQRLEEERLELVDEELKRQREEDKRRAEERRQQLAEQERRQRQEDKRRRKEAEEENRRQERARRELEQKRRQMEEQEAQRREEENRREERARRELEQKQRKLEEALEHQMMRQAFSMQSPNFSYASPSQPASRSYAPSRPDYYQPTSRSNIVYDARCNRYRNLDDGQFVKAPK